MRDIDEIIANRNANQTPVSSSTGRVPAGDEPSSTFQNNIGNNWLIFIILLTVATAFLLRRLGELATSNNGKVRSTQFEKSEQEMDTLRDNNLSSPDGGEQNAGFQNIRNGTLRKAPQCSGKVKNTNTENRRLRNSTNDDNVITKYISGGYGLAKSFWTGLIGGWFVLWAARIIMTVTLQDRIVTMAGRAGLYFTQIAPYRYFWPFLITYVLYAAVTSISVVKAGDKFTGNPIWVHSSRLFVVLFVISSILLALSAYGNYIRPIN